MDRITAKDANVKIMERAMEKALRDKPLWFFTNIVMPLLPRETRAAVEASDTGSSSGVGWLRSGRERGE